MCAGKTIYVNCHAISFEKHPRVCGEDVRSIELEADISETPPCVRGRLIVPSSEVKVAGNTPVCAGKTR